MSAADADAGAPPLALTMGEPAGVCGEIAVTAYRAAAASRDRPFFLIADLDWARAAAKGAGVAVEEIGAPEAAARVFPRALPVLREDLARKAEPGRLDPANAAAVIAALERGVAFAQSGAVDAVVTNPIHKKTLFDGAGFDHPGHTEFLAARAGAPRTVMLLASDALKVAPATIHMALADVSRALTPVLLEETIRILATDLSRLFGIARPRIAVAGLNPHAGEGGAFGREEIAVIAPTLKRLRAEGVDLIGPASADTLFHAAARRGYDAALCMYHDQALIPAKTLAFDDAVNVTLGLPFVRTSPDHGPALDIAGRGVASPASMIAALRLGARLGATKRRGAA